MKRLLTLYLVLLSATLNSSAQEMWGAATSNYSGQMGIALNPAIIVNAPYAWELHVLSFDQSIYNNFAYLDSKSNLFRKSFAGESVNQDNIKDKNTSNPNKNAYSSTFLKYPAFIWSGKKLALAFQVSSRAELSANNVPNHLAKFIKEGFDYAPQHGINYKGDNIKTSFLNWHEIAVTAGTKLYDGQDWLVKGAMTVKYNYGLNGLFANIDNVDYLVASPSQLIVNNMNATYGHALPDNGENGAQKTLAKKGGGWSTDIGFLFYKNYSANFYNPCIVRKDGKPYDYRIGVSLLDIGYVKFDKDASTYRFENVSTNWTGIDTVNFNGIDKTDSILGVQFYGTEDGALDKNSFTIATPASINAQIDYCINTFYYVNLSVMQRLPFGDNVIRRANQIALTPRFETRKLEIALPITYYDLFKPRVGFSVRYGAFTLGSDAIGALFGVTNTFGTDIYFGITLKHFGSCDRGNGSRKKVQLEQCKTPR